MPFPLLLLLLAGGVAVVAASSPSGSGPARDVPRPAGGAAPLTYEKFLDPVLVCLEQTPDWSGKPYVRPGNFETGLDYLRQTKNTPSARVEAMRTRAGSAEGQITRFPDTELGRIANASFQRVQSLAISMSSAYDRAEQWASIAKSFKVPVLQVAEQAKRIAELRLGSQATFIREAAKYAPVAQSIMSAVSSIAMGRTSKEQVYAQAAGVLGAAVAAAVADTVPIVGQVVGMAAQAFADDMKRAQQRKADACASYAAEVNKIISETVAENFPFPLHAVRDFGGWCDGANNPTPNEQMLEGVLRGNLQAFRSLSVRDKASVVQWWALAAALMSQPEVFAVFDRLGHGKIGRSGIPPYGNGFGYVGHDVGLYGGALGSDEQVMLVAAPYAVANGYPVDYFAKALWERSAGWRGADPKSFVRRPKAKNGESFTVCRREDEACFPICVGADVPMNAWALNFAVLSRDAAELARTLPKPR